MRLLHCSDFHGTTRWYDWLVQTAPRYDLVCLAGDLLDQSSGRSADAQPREIKAALKRVKTPLAICSGNHDLVLTDEGAVAESWVRDLKRKNVWVDGDRFELGGYNFYCHPWPEPLPPAMADEIWIIHHPPAGSTAADSFYSGDRGDPEFAEMCQAGQGPRLALCGHVHTPHSWHSRIGRTFIGNPGSDSGAEWPHHVMVDLKAGSATWYSWRQQVETVRLFRPSIAVLLGRFPPSWHPRLLREAMHSFRLGGYQLSQEEFEECCRRYRALSNPRK